MNLKFLMVALVLEERIGPTREILSLIWQMHLYIKKNIHNEISEWVTKGYLVNSLLSMFIYFTFSDNCV